MDISGKIKSVKETQTIGSNGFKKREVIIETNEQYPQPLLIEFVQDKCELLNNFSINDEVEISINLRGKEWESPTGEIKYFNTFQGWKISKINKTPVNPLPPISNEEHVNTTESENDPPF